MCKFKIVAMNETQTNINKVKAVYYHILENKTISDAEIASLSQDKGISKDILAILKELTVIDITSMDDAIGMVEQLREETLKDTQRREYFFWVQEVAGKKYFVYYRSNEVDGDSKISSFLVKLRGDNLSLIGHTHPVPGNKQINISDLQKLCKAKLTNRQLSSLATALDRLYRFYLVFKDSLFVDFDVAVVKKMWNSLVKSVDALDELTFSELKEIISNDESFVSKYTIESPLASIGDLFYHSLLSSKCFPKATLLIVDQNYVEVSNGKHYVGVDYNNRASLIKKQQEINGLFDDQWKKFCIDFVRKEKRQKMAETSLGRYINRRFDIARSEFNPFEKIHARAIDKTEFSRMPIVPVADFFKDVSSSSESIEEKWSRMHKDYRRRELYDGMSAFELMLRSIAGP